MIMTITSLRRLVFALLLALPVAGWAETVYLDSGVKVAKERGLVKGTFLVWRSGQDALTVRIKAPTGSAHHPWVAAGVGDPVDYSVVGMAPILAGPLAGSTGYTIAFAYGETSKVVEIVPLQDTDIEGLEDVTLEIMSDPAYTKGSPNFSTVDLADDDMELKLETGKSEADEDITREGLISDPFVDRRGFLRAIFTDGQTGNPAGLFDRTVSLQISGTATYSSDYGLSYRICGNTTGTGSISKMGSASFPATSRSTGTGYQIVAHRNGEFFIWVSGTGTTSGTTRVRFNSAPSFEYTLAAPFAGSATGPVLIQLTTALQTNLINDTGVTFTAGVNPIVSTPEARVSRVYTAGTTQVEIANGSGGIYIGDVFTLGAVSNVFYVATSDVATSAGTLDFRCYKGGSSSGLHTDISATTSVNTLLSATPVGGILTLTVPQESTKLEVSINPVADGLVEGSEYMEMTLVDSSFYAIVNPTVGRVNIADRDATVGVAVVSNAGKPGTTGSFRIKLTPAFPIAVTIPYTVTGTAVPGDISSSAQLPRIDYNALTPGVNGPTTGAYAAYTGSYTGSVTVPPGVDSVQIPVVPGSQGGLSTPTPTVTLTLDPTRSYKIVGSSGSGFLPSDTMTIGASLGGVSLAATDATAVEATTPTAATTGAFTVSVPSNATAQIGVNLRISGSATYLSRYRLTVGGSPLALTAIGTNVFTASVPILVGTSSTVVQVVPIDNFSADGSQTVIVELMAGSNYTQVTSLPAVVTISDDEPTISVIVGQSASKPSTPGYFVVGYAGATLGRTVTVNFSLAGTAVQGTDYLASSTLTISASGTSTQFIIDPLATPDDTDKTVIFTILPSNEYSIGVSPSQMIIGGATSSSGTKPTPGTINTGGSGGCGLGSGIATLAGLGLLALRLTLIRRRRRD